MAQVPHRAWPVPRTFAALIFALVSLVNLANALMDHWVRAQWHRAYAAGRTVSGETTAPHRVTGNWSEPVAIPSPGERVSICLDPADPARMRPVSSILSTIATAMMGML